MSTNVSSAKETKHLIAYFILAYAISWAIGVPLALAKQALILSLIHISEPTRPY